MFHLVEDKFLPEGNDVSFLNFFQPSRIAGFVRTSRIRGQVVQAFMVAPRVVVSDKRHNLLLQIH